MKTLNSAILSRSLLYLSSILQYVFKLTGVNLQTEVFSISKFESRRGRHPTSQNKLLYSIQYEN